MEGWITPECDMNHVVDDKPDLLATLINGWGEPKMQDPVIATICQDEEA